MKIVLLSGGSGQRLWPLSNNSRSKQFLKVLNGSNDERMSMVQKVWGQLKEVKLDNSTVIATGASQVDMLRNQIGAEVPLIVEPERRDTFSAIALAASYLHTVLKVSEEEVISVLPVDPYVDTNFFYRVKDLENLLHSTECNLGLIGVSPTFPSSKYGYIVPNSNENNFFEVKNFQEKPNEELAKKLIDNGALWNTGVFAFKLKYILELVENKGFSTDYETLLNSYHELPKISFDYEVVENANEIMAISYEGYWKDLGTWNTLTEEMITNVVGNASLCNNSKNTHLFNELELPIIGIGLKDLIIAASADGILISNKSDSPKIKTFLSGINNRPMFEEKRWGNYQIIDKKSKKEGFNTLTKKITVLPGENISYQYHLLRKEMWTILEGEGQFVLEGRLYPLKAGDMITVLKGERHCIKALSKLELIEVQMGSELTEEDNIRITNDWNEILDICAETTK